MAIKKQYLKTKDVCKATFKLSTENADGAETAALVGDFNNWNALAHPMKRLKKDGSFSITIELGKDEQYEFRYLLDGHRWCNDPEADGSVPTIYGDSENSVITI